MEAFRISTWRYHSFACHDRQKHEGLQVTELYILNHYAGSGKPLWSFNALKKYIEFITYEWWAENIIESIISV